MTPINDVPKFIPCERCGGVGRIEWTEYVTHDMALDAGQPSREGEPIRCSQACPHCGGHGFIDPSLIEAQDD